VPVLLGQRGVCGEVEGRLGQGVKDCSSFFEGKEELSVEEALFNIGLSASCVIAGEADIAVACVSKRLACDGAAEYEAWRQLPEKLFPDSRIGERVYMAKQSSGRQVTVVDTLPSSHSHACPNRDVAQELGRRKTRGLPGCQQQCSAKRCWCGEWEREYQTLD
jgi:hypothetical protein